MQAEFGNQEWIGKMIIVGRFEDTSSVFTAMGENFGLTYSRDSTTYTTIEGEPLLTTECSVSMTPFAYRCLIDDIYFMYKDVVVTLYVWNINTGEYRITFESNDKLYDDTPFNAVPLDNEKERDND